MALGSVVVHTFEQIYLQDQLADFSQNLSVASFGWVKGCITFLGRLDQNSDFHIKVAGNQDRHKNQYEFDFRLDQMAHFAVICHFSVCFFV